MLTWQQAADLARHHGGSFFVLDREKLAVNIEHFRSQFRSRYPRTRLAYPYKANHLPAICRQMAGEGLSAEVSSPMELWLARRLDVPGHMIIYNGPGRSAESLAAALLVGAMINIDSGRDLRILEGVAAEHPGREFAVGLRCSFPLAGRDGSRFGFPVGEPEFEQALDQLGATPGLRLAGLHCHFPGSELTSFADRTRQLIEAADRAFPHGPPDYLDVGGGFYGGVPFSIDSSPDARDYALAVTQLMTARYGSGRDVPWLVIEPGTALVATAVNYVSEVVDIKRWGRRTVATVAGTLFHTSPNTRRVDFPVEVLSPRLGGPSSGSFDIAGSTALPDEYLSLCVDGDIAPGDFVLFRNVGAYSLSMSPQFSAPAPAVLESTDEGWRVLAPAGTPEQVFNRLLG